MQNEEKNLVKTCTKCGQTKPATLEHFRKHAKCLYGLNSVCKECEKLMYIENREKKLQQAKDYNNANKEKIAEKNKKYREEHRGKLIEYSRNYYRQNIDKLRQNQINYYYKNRDYILKYKKQYRIANREKVLKIEQEHYYRKGKYTQRKWAKANRDKINKCNIDCYYKNHDSYLKTRKKWRDNNRERIKYYNKKWITENPEKYEKFKKIQYQKKKDNPKYKSYMKIYGKKYFQLNKSKMNLRYHRRDALKKNLINDFSYSDWKECLEFFGNKDAYTGLPMETISQDHVIPISKGGHYTKTNIIPCEKSINSSKNNNDMEEWYRKQSYFLEERLSKIKDWVSKKEVVLCDE